MSRAEGDPRLSLAPGLAASCKPRAAGGPNWRARLKRWASRCGKRPSWPILGLEGVSEGLRTGGFTQQRSKGGALTPCEEAARCQRRGGARAKRKGGRNLERQQGFSAVSTLAPWAAAPFAPLDR